MAHHIILCSIICFHYADLTKASLYTFVINQLRIYVPWDSCIHLSPDKLGIINPTFNLERGIILQHPEAKHKSFEYMGYHVFGGG